MKEQEWLTCDSVKWMLAAALRVGSSRKSRLFAVECARAVMDWVFSEPPLEALGTAERHAEGLATDTELQQAHAAFEHATAPIRAEQAFCPWDIMVRLALNAIDASTEADLDEGALSHIARLCEGVVEYSESGQSTVQQESQRQVALVRDIFGNPFRPVAFNPAWRTTDVLLLARGIYDDRAFDRLPILADALQDAGCDSDDILNHCRALKHVHVRGCWVVDLVLGKE